MTAIKEIQVIKCPTKKSFDSHFKAWSHIQKICQSHDCNFEWKVLNKTEKTFILKVYGFSKQAQQNALIEVTKFLCKEGIEPAIVISTETEKSDAENKLFQMQEILKKVEVPV